jgi:hypothetical protein
MTSADISNSGEKCKYQPEANQSTALHITSEKFNLKCQYCMKERKIYISGAYVLLTELELCIIDREV